MIQDLQLSLELESITQVQFDADYLWHVLAQCSNCQEKIEDLYCRVSEVQPIPNSRGEANCVVKCKLCERHAYIKIRSSSDPIIYTSEQSGNYVTVASFDCRGVILTRWIPESNQLSAQGVSSNAVYHNLDLNDEFFEYDEGAGVPVSITEIRHNLFQVNNKQALNVLKGLLGR